jgi:hypothetical protein
MHEVKLGQLIEGEPGRDAIHIAVAPAVAAQALPRGADVGLLPDGRAGFTDNPIGIVDPFLKVPIVDRDQRFWLLLYPNTITSLRHEWVHPAFGESASDACNKAEAEAWLRDFAEECGISYEEAIDAGREFVKTGMHFVFRGQSTPDRCYTERRSFWRNWEIVTGERASMDDYEEVPFTCSC